MPELRTGSIKGDSNPYNPFALNTEFKVNILDDAAFFEMRDQMHAQKNGVPLDNEMIVFEGCDQDDKIVLGGKNPFLSHFCTFFNFGICYAAGESKMIQKNIKKFNDPQQLDKNLEGFLESFDKKMA